VIFNPSANGNFPKAYNIYVSKAQFGTTPFDGVSDKFYGLVGYHEHNGTSQTAQQSWEDQYLLPDYNDGPPTQRDPFSEVVQMITGGSKETQPFIGGGPTEWTNADAGQTLGFLDQYTWVIDVILDPGEWVEFELYARGDSGDPWVLYDSRRVENNGSEQTLSTIYPSAIIVDPGGTWNAPWKRFRVLITDKSATVNQFIPRRTEWTISISSESNQDTYPSSVCFHEQRLVFGGFTHNKQLIRSSQVGDFFNFDQGILLQEDDSFDLVLASLRIDAIKQLIPGDQLMVLTAGGEWVVRGVDGGPITPTSFDAKQKTAYGTDDPQALQVGDAVIFATDRGRRVREFLPGPFGNDNRSRDLSVMVEHLFRMETVQEFQYADVPYQVIWMPRSDGILLGLTYVREHNVFAWHHHDTGGVYTDGVPRDLFESVAAVPEGNETSVYAIVRRQINGATKRYVELMAPRHFTDAADGIFVDSALTFDGRNTGSTQIRLQSITGTHDGGTHATILTDSGEGWALDEWIGNTIKNTTDGSQGTATDNDATTITLDALTGGGDNQWEASDAYEIVPTWVAQEKMILNADTASTFVAGDVGKKFELRVRVLETAQDDSGRLSITDYKVRVAVLSFIDDQNLEVVPDTAVPTQLQTVYTSDWGRAENSFSGLDHLEGETIAVLVDGATHADVTVTSGSITLDSGIFGERVQAGIQYVSELVTLPLDVQGDTGSLRLSKKIISGVGVELDDFRGVYVGHKRSKMTPAQQRAVSDAYETIDPDNTLVILRPESSWKRQVNLIIQQREPIPVSILAFIVELGIGGNQ
jgi:hypothetical protein